MEHDPNFDLEAYYVWDLDTEVREAYYFDLVAFLGSPPCCSYFVSLRSYPLASSPDPTTSCLYFASYI